MHSQVGPYRIVERLGTGGMGEVFLAEDTRLGRKVALKSLTDSSMAAPEARARILREAGAAATVNHPNVAAVYDVLDEGDRAHIVMEYVPGETLASQVHRGPLSMDRVVQIGMQLCDGLAAAHAAGVIHRDLKPANVRVTPEGRVKVLDFGLAHRPTPAHVSPNQPPELVVQSLAEGGQLLGTPAYMAPEVLLGHEADVQSDIYSLGVSLFELITGRPPFEGRNFVSVALAVLTEPPPSVTRLIPGGLGEVVARAMAREPEERYATVGQLRRDLASLSAELHDMATGVLKLPPPASRSGAPSVRLSRRSRWWLGVSSAVLVFALGLLVGPFSGRGPSAAPAPIVAVWPMPTIADPESRSDLGTGVASLLQGALANRLGHFTVVPPPDGAQGAAGDLREAARTLGVSFIVPVRVHVRGDEVLVDVQLLRASNASVIGSLRQRTSLAGDGYFDLPERLAGELAGLLVAAVGGPAEERLARSGSAATGGAGTALTGEDLVLYSRALALIERRYVPNNIETAIALLEELLARAPVFAPGYAALAEAQWVQYRETRTVDMAHRSVQSAEQAVGLDPGGVRAVTALARSYEAVGRAPEGIAALRAALDHHPRSDDLRRMLGEILVAAGDVEAGLAELHQAIEIRPEYWENHSALGAALYERGRFREALAPLGRAVELQPGSPLHHQRLGATHQQLGQTEQALAAYGEAARLGGSPSVHANMGTILHYQGDYEEALQHYDAALAQRDSETTWRSKGDTLAKLGRHDDARVAWTRAVELAERTLAANPTDARTRGFLAVCLAKVGERERARTLAGEAVTAAPDDPFVLYRATVVNALTGRLDVARTLLRQALDHGYSRADAAQDEDLQALRPLELVRKN